MPEASLTASLLPAMRRKSPEHGSRLGRFSVVTNGKTAGIDTRAGSSKEGLGCRKQSESDLLPEALKAMRDHIGH